MHPNHTPTPPVANRATSDPRTAPQAITRRKLLQQSLTLGLMATGGGLLAACGGSPRTTASNSGSAPAERVDNESVGMTCSENRRSSGLEAVQVKALQYVDQSPEQGKNCSNCQLYQAVEGSAAACGRCDALPIVVSAGGYCRAWSAA